MASYAGNSNKYGRQTILINKTEKELLSMPVEQLKKEKEALEQRLSMWYNKHVIES